MYLLNIKNIILLFLALFFIGCGRSQMWEFTQQDYPADGISGGMISWKHGNNKSRAEMPPLDPAGAIVITTVVDDYNREKIYFKSSGKSGKVEFLSTTGEKIALNFWSAELDSDDDGFPDVSELKSEEDRWAFRNWIVRIAEAQFLNQSTAWSLKERDCAGLIRVAYREALKKHDSRWFERFGLPLDKNLADVECFNYPDIPVIGEKLFKIKSGKASEIESFGVFADAETLIASNVKFISKDVTVAEKGDILFFEDRDNEEWPFHSMLVSESNKGNIKLIYHTGSNSGIKRVPVEYLYSSEKFRPVPGNPRFLGLYRFKILE